MKNGCGWAAFSRCLSLDFDVELSSVVAQVDWNPICNDGCNGKYNDAQKLNIFSHIGL